MNRRTVGLLLMAVAAAFLIFGSGWIMDRAYSGSDWMEAHEIGLIIGGLALGILSLAWRFPQFGSVVAAITSGSILTISLAFVLPFGDMEERLEQSITMAIVVFNFGALLVFVADKNGIEKRLFGMTSTLIYIFYSLVIVERLMILFSFIFET